MAQFEKKINIKKYLIKTLGYCLSFCFFSLALLHFSPDSRFALQNWLVGLDSDFKQSIYDIVGGRYFIHNFEDSAVLHVSLVHKLPTRYIRDIIFWRKLKPGVSFAVEALQPNSSGIKFIYFDSKASRYAMHNLPGLNKDMVCLNSLPVWRIKFGDSPSLPSYAAVDYQYTISFSTDDTTRWKQLEAPCIKEP